MKKFNVTGTCIPEENYMVDLTDKLEQIKKMIDAKEYFTINRGRQYGKTTTLLALEEYIADLYTAISISFEGMGDESFASEAKFCTALLRRISSALRFSGVSKDYQETWNDPEVKDFDLLGEHITNMCEGRKLILMIDEVDKASNNRIFLGFLSKLREKFLARRARRDYTFHSVILVGVYDVKNIKLKMIQEGLITPSITESKTYNSPWNIAVNFEVDMSFSAQEIMGMLEEYESDHQTGMDTAKIAEEIYSYTSGYPFLVSRICQYLDEELAKNWTRAGITEAVALMTEEPHPSTLFDDLFKNIRNHQALSNFLYQILMEGTVFKFSLGNEVFEQALRYAYIRIIDRNICIHNKIFETLMASYFINEELLVKKKLVKNSIEEDVVSGEQFNIELFFEKFNTHYQKHYSQRDEDFIEREAAFLFLFFLQPYLNGKGSFHLESKPNFATGKRMDIIISYGGEEFIIELKIWRGEKRQQDAYQQLTDYVKKRDAQKGYLLTFDFRKKKEVKQEWVEIHQTRILKVQV